MSSLLVLVLVFVVYNRRREAQIKYPGPEDDVRENIINYEDEGGGEDDMTAFDITPLQIPIADPSLAHHSLPRQKVQCKYRSDIISISTACHTTTSDKLTLLPIYITTEFRSEIEI